jgi:hypothetical protein
VTQDEAVTTIDQLVAQSAIVPTQLETNVSDLTSFLKDEHGALSTPE